MTEVNTSLADGHFHKGGQLIPTLQFRRKLAHEMMDTTIGADTLDSGRPIRSSRTLAIVTCNLLKVKKHEGSYKKRQKNQKNQAGISKIEMRQL